MSKNEADKHINAIGEIVDMSKAGMWYKENLSSNTSWCNKTNKDGYIEPTLDMVDEMTATLKPDFDNAYLAHKGLTPTIEDYNNLKEFCERVDTEDGYGAIFKNGDSQLYFPYGDYWTSSCELSDEGKIVPYSVSINKGTDLIPSTKYKSTKLLKIKPIKERADNK